jgi:hypothetical protein
MLTIIEKEYDFVGKNNKEIKVGEITNDFKIRDKKQDKSNKETKK